MTEKEIEKMKYDLLWAKTMLNIRKADARDLDTMMRLTHLKELPYRAGREEQLSGLIGTPVVEGLYVLDGLHRALRKVSGSICEFGVAQGATSALIAAEILSTDRHYYLFDSFEGLPAPTKEDVLLHDIFNLGSMEAYAGYMASPEEEVRGRVSAVNFPDNRLHVRQGWVKDTIASGDLPDKIAFAYVDFDFYEPIRDALVFMDGKSDPGAVAVIDDYGVFSAGAQTATDEFVANSSGRWELKKPEMPGGGFVTLLKHA